ncbi:hypothetical protein [Sphingobium sp. HDIP04]|uniref:hypothetical protein n=1 Tax=Sphingobium sp. HDIP04 TaxID=428994 RepID=UPI00038777B3|nr:hypothetical protein [Sphingobium sp. HDIP04]EQA97271.1 hypothetical protein L286_23385 [Sphingobium sp. HDIP04]
MIYLQRIILAMVAQAEYRWIESFGAGRQANMRSLGRFDLRVWLKLVTDFFDREVARVESMSGEAVSPAT